MGTLASRQTNAVCTRCTTLTRSSVKEAKDTRLPAPMHRAEVRKRTLGSTNQKDERTDEVLREPEGTPERTEAKFQRTLQSSEAGYAQLSSDDPDDFDTMVARGRCSQQMMDWAQDWMHSAESGELDIFTCLGLSNGCTCSADTRKIVAKVVAVCVLQLIIPCILLQVELAQGFSFFPKESTWSFRVMGSCLYLYSLYSMYNNALDECRSASLQWCIDQKAAFGYWWPLMLGEFSNVFVSLILVSTLFVIFTDVEHPADLILNAVAVNFLGAVDGEFVDDEMKQEAVRNFRRMFQQYGNDMIEPQGEVKIASKILRYVLTFSLAIVVLQGCILSGVFLFAPSPSHPVNSVMGSRGHKTMGDYPRLV